ncbi:MAG: Lpg1974 family pore-forming outer membrane protein [Legionella sp.]
MLNLKKTAVAVLAFGSSAVFAGTMGPVCAPGNVTVPCEKTAWDFGIQALYLQPSLANGVGAYHVSSTPTAINAREVDSDWNWGFKLEGSYHFSTGNDLTVGWYHIGDNSKTTHGYDSIVKEAKTTVATDRFRVKPGWDAVNVEFGQHVDFGEFKKIRFHGGVQYANLKTEARHTGKASVTGSTTPFNYSSVTTLRHSGFGPRIGADYSYELGNGLAMYAKGASSILSGTSRTKSNVTPELATALDVRQQESLSRTVIVPEVEAKLGMTYTWAMSQGDLSLDVGYMWVNYFNAQQTATNTDSNFGLSGPFAGLKWVGTVV